MVAYTCSASGDGVGGQSSHGIRAYDGDVSSTEACPYTSYDSRICFDSSNYDKLQQQ